MSSNIRRSPGVSAREIDTSQPSVQAPSGIPAGIIGTAERGPAFVPKYFGAGGYVTNFGEISSDHYGSLAAAMWLGNGGPSCLFVRVLGAGNCKARNSNGTVTNAGFTVGNEIPQSSDLVSANPYANSSATFGIKGRTYFLGCFMSESNGSTIFSDAGIQDTATKATATIMPGNPLAATNGDTLILTNADGTSVTFTVANGGASATQIQNNGNINSTATFAQAVRASLILAQTAGTLKMDVSALTNNSGAEATVITLTQHDPGQGGNKKRRGRN